VNRSKGVRAWNDRLHHSEDSEESCGPDEVKRVKLPCELGVACADSRDFDLMRDSGVKKKFDEVVKVPGGPSSRKKTAQFLDRSQGHLTPSSPNIHLHSETASHHPSRYNPDALQQWSSAYGDVFTLSRLMELAGADLDKSFNMENWTTRESGTVLEVSAVYSNLHAWISSFGYKDVNYYYRVKELPLPYVSRKHLAEVQPPDFPETRRYEIQHGTMIWFRFVGEFGNFKTTYLLIYLVTAFALIGAASAATDFIAIYIHKRKNNYFNLKYQISGDFSEFWQCPKCSYWNSKLHSKCEQYAMWEDSEGAARCCEPRPT